MGNLAELGGKGFNIKIKVHIKQDRWGVMEEGGSLAPKDPRKGPKESQGGIQRNSFKKSRMLWLMIMDL